MEEICKSTRHNWAAPSIPHDGNRFSCRYVVFEKSQKTNNGQIIVVFIAVITSTIGFTFQCRPRTRNVALISNNVRPGITNHNYNLHHKKYNYEIPMQTHLKYDIRSRITWTIT